MKYKPLTDEELATGSWLDKYRVKRLEQQCCRANRLAKAVRLFINEFVDKTGEASDLGEALDHYLSEDSDDT